MSKHELIERMEELDSAIQIALDEGDNRLASELQCELNYLTSLFSEFTPEKEEPV